MDKIIRQDLCKTIEHYAFLIIENIQWFKHHPDRDILKRVSGYAWEMAKILIKLRRAS